MEQRTASAARYSISPRQRRSAKRMVVLVLLTLLTLAHVTPVGVAGGAAAVERRTGPLAGTLVVLAETEEAPGQRPLEHFQALADAANHYYALNAYGCVQFDFAFPHAAGPTGPGGWTRLEGARADYGDMGYGYAVAALQKALAGMDLPEEVYLERAIVITSEEAQQASAGRVARASTLWLPGDHAIEIPGLRHNARVYVPNIVFLSEGAELGAWVHELAHTLRARYETDGGYNRVADRYNDAQAARTNGQVGMWDLMGSGTRWGSPEGASPTHMSSYTKEAAGWLHFRPAALDQDVVLTSLENQTMGDPVLTLDDPLSDEPESYYILEARDGDAPFGAPESGVVIYYVTRDRQAGRTVVGILNAQTGDVEAVRLGQAYQRATLHGIASPDGASEHVLAGGLVVRLLAESFAPYRATVRIARYRPSGRP